MKTFKQLTESVRVGSSKEMRDWIIQQVEQTDLAHDEIKSNFMERYGHGKLGTEAKKLSAFFDSVVHEEFD